MMQERLPEVIPMDQAEMEMAATAALFEQLHLPTGHYRRRLNTDDAQAYVDFDTLTYYQKNDDTPTDHQCEPYKVEQVSDWLETLVLAEAIFNDQDEMVASLMLEPERDGIKDLIDITNINVHPNRRDRSIGRFFLNVTEVIAQLRGFDRCTLRVDPLNGRGLYLYIKQGYQITEYDKIDKWVYMTKQLYPTETPDYSFELEVNAGDDQLIEQTLEQGYIGVDFVNSGGRKDPKANFIIFAK